MAEARRASDILLRNYDDMLKAHGDTAQGANWPNEEDCRTRFDVMLDVIAREGDMPVVLCDLACGTAGLLARIRERGLRNISYVGADRSAAALDYARAKFPEATFVEIDVQSPDADLARLKCDYLVANGLFTVKWDMTNDQMWSFLKSTVSRVWPFVRRGVAFNVMSKIVDWERDDLFHLSMDDAARFLHGLAGRHVRLRADYGLYEYAAFAFKPEASSDRSPRGAPPRPRGMSEPSPFAYKASASPTSRVPAFRPQLPNASEVARYLRRLDERRIYTNHGPLLQELQQRLSERLKAPADGVACASSGTAALVGAILAAAGRASAARPFALAPAFTFIATASAAEQCGYQLYIEDIDATSWALDPDALIDHPLRDRIGLVIPIAPFGRPVPQAPWRAFSERTGIPVVIDGAAEMTAIDRDPETFLGAVPVALSFHATKSFSVGEGGAIVSTDTKLVARAVQALNFGFLGARDSRTASINGKMSEYLAAVGLAELDRWDERLRAFDAVARAYRRRMRDAGLHDLLWTTPEVAPNYVLLECPDVAAAQRVQANLDRAEIDYRLWYGKGLHAHAYLADAARGRLANTDALAPRLLGLPVAPDLDEDTIARITAAAADGLRKRPTASDG